MRKIVENTMKKKLILENCIQKTKKFSLPKILNKKSGR